MKELSQKKAEENTRIYTTRINETNVCLEFVTKCFEGTKCVSVRVCAHFSFVEISVNFR